MKLACTTLIMLLLASCAAMAEEGEHEAHKPPPKPSAGSPVGQVFALPVVQQWDKTMTRNKGIGFTAWGESLKTVEGVECSEVAVGENLPGGASHVWRRFCVPIDGSEILVEGKSAGADGDITYTPYSKWVSECKPTENSQGSC